VQAAVVGVLLIGAGFFVLSSSGGGESEEESAAATEATVSVAGTDASGTATGATPGEAVENAVEAATAPSAGSIGFAGQAATAAPPLPRPVLDAWHANQTLVLLFVHDGGIDDRLVRTATAGVAGFPGVTSFVVPAGQVYRYAAITEGVGVDRVPALVVVRPKHLKRTVPTASVSFGFQSAESVRQAVIDAGYEGPTVDYHP
jgi:hypothetical protein